MKSLEVIIKDLETMELKNSVLLEADTYEDGLNGVKTYLHYNVKNGKIYVGQTEQMLGRRFRREGSGYKGNPRFVKAIRYHGWDSFKTIVIQDNLNLEEANKFEEELISKLNSTGKKTGYNDHAGGLNRKPSESTRKKLSISHMGNKSRLGAKHTPETKALLSKLKKEMYSTTQHFNKGRYGSESTRHVSITCINIETKDVIVRDSAVEAAKTIGVARGSSVVSVCRGRELTINKNICLYTKDFDGNVEKALEQYFISRKYRKYTGK